MVILTTAPIWLVGLFLVGGMTALAMAGPIFIRRRFPLERLRTNNEVAGFKFATVGVLYAVLLAFAVIVVWEKFAEADKDVALEAGATVTIFRLADGLGGEPGQALHEAITGYVESAIGEDWPAMANGHASPKTNEALNRVYEVLLRYEPADDRARVIMAEVLYQLDQVTQARRSRLVMASGIVPGVVWVVLFLGAFLTIGFTFFFGTENLRAQSLMTGALAVLIFSGLLIIIAIDHPFAGTVHVGTDPLDEVIADFVTNRGG